MNKLKQKILQSDFYKKVYQHRNSKTIDLYADSIESGMEEASALLKCPIYELSYQVLSEGSVGIFGVGTKLFHIQYRRLYYKDSYLLDGSKRHTYGGTSDDGSVATHNIIDKNTEVFARIKRDGIFLKVTPPVKNGNKITDVSFLNESLDKVGAINYNNEKAKEIFIKAESKFEKIGEYNEINDHLNGKIILNISNDYMRVVMKITKPKKGGREADYEDFDNIIQKNLIISGIKRDIATSTIENQIYTTPTLIAESTIPIMGENARVELFFNKEKSYSDIEDTENIDYKNLSNIKSVTIDQVLGEKIAATIGEDGHDVLGKTIEAYKGKDLDINDYLGNNVAFDSNTNIIKSTIDGQVVLTNKLVSVEPLLEIAGDVGPETGNIDFLGSVLIKGSVLDNYSVSAKGNIDVMGSVGKSDLLSHGNIVVKLGIQGSEANTVKADGDILAKFIQFGNVEAGGDVVVNEAILNSNIDSENNILLIGKKAIASGGRLRAYKKVIGKVLGSTSNTKTIIETGIHPENRKKMSMLESEKLDISEKLEPLSINIKSMNKIKKTKGLDEERTEQLENEIIKFDEYNNRIAEIKEEISTLKMDIDNNISTEARVCVEKTAHAGVSIYVGHSELDLRTDYTATSFFENSGLISTEAYSEADENSKKASSTNTLDVKKTEYQSNVGK